MPIVEIFITHYLNLFTPPFIYNTTYSWDADVIMHPVLFQCDLMNSDGFWVYVISNLKHYWLVYWRLPKLELGSKLPKREIKGDKEIPIKMYTFYLKKINKKIIKFPLHHTLLTFITTLGYNTSQLIYFIFYFILVTYVMFTVICNSMKYWFKYTLDSMLLKYILDQ